MRNAHRAYQSAGAAVAAPGRITRRHVLLGAATVGVGGAVAGAAGLSEAFDTQSAGGDAQDLVIHVLDVRAGRLDIYAGDQRVEVRDRDLAAKLAKAAKGR